MKRTLLTLGIILLLLVVGVAIFLATFNADRYRPLLVEKLEQIIGRPVTLDRLSLAWRGGVAIRLDGLSIAEEGGGLATEPLMQLESATAFVRLAPLLHREVQVSSVLLQHPRIHIVRDAQGRINLLGVAAVVSPAASANQLAGNQGASAATTSQSAREGSPALLLAIGSLRIQNGMVHWTDTASIPVDERWLKAVNVTVEHIAFGKPMDIDATASLNGTTPDIHVHGRLTLPVSEPLTDHEQGHVGSLTQVKVTLERVPLDVLLPIQPAGTPQWQGKLTFSFEGQVPTLDSTQLLQALSGTSHVKLDDGKVAHLNLLREVFNRLSILPGLVERLEARLPQEYRAKLNAEDTVFAPVDCLVQLEQGAARLDGVSLKTDVLGFSDTTGTVGLDGVVHLRTILHIDPEFSSAIIHSVSEVQQLTNSSGELEIPVTIEGQGSHIVPLPDLRYIASKVLATKAINLLDRLLKPKDQSPETGESQSPPAPSQSGNLLDQLLQNSLQKSR